MKKLLISTVTIFSFLGCNKNTSDLNDVDNSNKSLSDKIAGLYSGTGKYLPGNINLGNTIVCNSPAIDFNTLYQTSGASVNIIKITDSTVNIVMSSGPFPLDTYNDVLLKENGTTITFNDSLSIYSSSPRVLIGKVEINSGYFDPVTNNISFSRQAPNFVYTYDRNCYSGLPYYHSIPVPDPVTGLMVYSNSTNKRYVFNGNK